MSQKKREITKKGKKNVKSGVQSLEFYITEYGENGEYGGRARQELHLDRKSE